MKKKTLRFLISALGVLVMAHGCQGVKTPAHTPDKELAHIEARAKGVQTVPAAEQVKTEKPSGRFEGMGVAISRWFNGPNSNYARHADLPRQDALAADLRRKAIADLELAREKAKFEAVKRYVDTYRNCNGPNWSACQQNEAAKLALAGKVLPEISEEEARAQLAKASLKFSIAQWESAKRSGDIVRRYRMNEQKSYLSFYSIMRRS